MLKFKPTPKYDTVAVYAVIIMSALCALIFALLKLGDIWSWIANLLNILSPFFYGFVIAYLCNPIMKFYDKRLFGFVERKKPRKNLRRALSIILAYVTLLAFITLFMLLVIPQVKSSYTDLTSKISGYVTAAQEWADSFISNSPIFGGKYADLNEFLDVNELKTQIKDFISNSYNLIEKLANYIISYSGEFLVQTKNVIIGLIISVYFLISKAKLRAQTKKLCTAFLSDEKRDKLFELARFTDDTFGGFIIGKLLDSLITGLLTFIVLAIFNMPYYPLIAVIIGVTNIIPFFGPFIGAIPSAFIIFIAEPEKAIWFIIIVLLIQQLDGNIIGPKILGDSTGLSSLWVIVAITIMGGLFGITGMFIGVPTFAVIYALAKRWIESKLAAKDLPVSTEAYYEDVPANNSAADNEQEQDKDEGGDTK